MPVMPVLFMTDIFTKRKRSEIMSLIRGKNTVPERIIRKALRAEGYAYRLQYGSHKIDVAFPKEKVAVFVDGCFWHGCPRCFRLPEDNRSYWLKKLRDNKRRDCQQTLLLRKKGWKVLRIWEHRLKTREKRARVITRLKQVL